MIVATVGRMKRPRPLILIRRRSSRRDTTRSTASGRSGFASRRAPLSRRSAYQTMSRSRGAPVAVDTAVVIRSMPVFPSHIPQTIAAMRFRQYTRWRMRSYATVSSSTSRTIRSSVRATGSGVCTCQILNRDRAVIRPPGAGVVFGRSRLRSDEREQACRGFSRIATHTAVGGGSGDRTSQCRQHGSRPSTQRRGMFEDGEHRLTRRKRLR